MSLVASFIQKSQEASNIESYSDKDASSNGTFFYPWYRTTSYGGFLVVNDGAQTISCHLQIMCYKFFW
jgi:hypothetical protein